MNDQDLTKLKRLDRAKIILVVVCDNHFAVMLAALLKSVEMTNEGNDLTVYIVDDGISERRKHKIAGSVMKNNIALIWIPIHEAIPKNTKLPLDGSSFPLSVYARLWIPFFVTSDIDRVIYLDVDTVVLGDLRELWEMDLEGFVIGAVTDRAETMSCSWAGIPNYAELGLHPDSKYFNTGVLVIDVQKWRETNATLGVIKCIEDNIQYASFPDQYGMNVHFADNWLEIDSSWNTYAQLDLPNPNVIHFTGMKPIYKGYHFNPYYRDKFYSYLKETPFRHYQPTGTYVRLLNKALHVMEKKWRYLWQ